VTSGLGSFAAVHDPERIESKITAPLCTSSKSAVTMLTMPYAKAFPEMRINAADPGYTATDFNANSGTQTVREGTDAIVDLATRGGGGPTGTFIDRSGVAPSRAAVRVRRLAVIGAGAAWNRYLPRPLRDRKKVRQ